MEAFLYTFISIVIIGAIVVFAILFSGRKESGEDRRRSSSHRSQIVAERRGKQGEETVAYMIERIQQKYGGYLINNIIVPVGKGSSQIDHVFISTKGVFVIETKNYSGRVYGDENQAYWTQVMGYGNIKNKLYNPLKQNETHVHVIKRLLRRDTPIIPMVIFVQGNVEYIKSNNVYTMNEARRLLVDRSDVLTYAQMYEIYDRIARFKSNPVITEEQHIANVRSRH